MFNLSDLELGAPVDEEIAKNLAEAIEAYIRRQALEVMEQAKREYESFLKNVNAETNYYDVSLLEDCPAGVIGDENKFTTFVRLRDHVYSGPASISDSLEWARVLNRVQDIVELSKLVFTQDGQMVLLKRIFDQPEYTIAHVKRDLRILQFHPPKEITEVSELSKWVTDATGNSLKYVEEHRNISAETKKRLMTEVTNKFDGFKSGIESKTLEAIGRHKAYSNILSTFFEHGLIANDFGGKIVDLARAGANYFHLNLSDYVVTHEPAKFEVAHLADYDSADGFMKLLCQENLFLPKCYREQAGTFDSSFPFRFDSDRFERDLDAAGRAYKEAFEKETIYCPFFTANDEPKYCTIPQLKEARNWERFKGFGGVIMPYWADRIEEAIQSLIAKINDKFKPDRKLKWVSVCGL